MPDTCIDSSAIHPPCPPLLCTKQDSLVTVSPLRILAESQDSFERHIRNILDRNSANPLLLKYEIFLEAKGFRHPPSLLCPQKAKAHLGLWCCSEEGVPSSGVLSPFPFPLTGFTLLIAIILHKVYTCCSTTSIFRMDLCTVVFRSGRSQLLFSHTWQLLQLHWCHHKFLAALSAPAYPAAQSWHSRFGVLAGLLGSWDMNLAG